MPTTTLILNNLLPRSSIELGRLVLDPKYPAQDFHQPPEPSTASISAQRVESFHDVLERSHSTRLGIKLLKLLTFTPVDSTHSAKTTLKAPVSVTLQLMNSESYFRDACQLDPVRAWLERATQRASPGLGRHRNVYLVCGLKTLTDARIEQRHHSSDKTDVSAAVPAAAIAAAAGVPLPILLDSGADIGGSVAVAGKADETQEYKAPGEQVFAVQYRKIKFGWFVSGKVDKSYLETGNRWKLFVVTRGGDGDGDGDESHDGIDVEVDEPVGLNDLRGSYEAVEMDGEEVLYRLDEDEK